MKIILVAILIGITSNHAQELEPCTTPNNKFGDCKLIRNCDSMVQFLLAKDNFTLTEREFLNKYQCGYLTDSPKICCPNNGIIVSGVDLSSRIITPPSASVQDHRNLKLLPLECGRNEFSYRIHNGNKTGIFDFPWMALLSYKTNYGPSFKCGGTIINNRYILTAAHCIVDKKLIGVRVGEHTISNKTDCEPQENDDGKLETVCAELYQDFLVEEAIVHSNYNQPHRAANDIALLRLMSTMRILKSVHPICLPVQDNASENLYKKEKFTVTGWGATETSQSSDDLLQTNVAPATLEDCQEKYKAANYTITEDQMCAKSINGSDSCNGDSGGPLQALNALAQYTQCGIVSIGPSHCAHESIPGVYTRVDKYLNWILDNMTD